MPFIEPNEYIIIADYHDIGMDRTDFAKLAEVGIKTILRNLTWRDVEAQQGVYQWDEYDYLLESVRSADLRLMLLVSDSVPAWCPPDWYGQSHDGHLQNDWPYCSFFSPWNNEAVAYQADFMRMAIQRYMAPDVLCIHGGSHGGEAILSPTAAYYDREARANFQRYAAVVCGGDLDEFNRREHQTFETWNVVEPGQDASALYLDSFTSDMTLRPITLVWLMHRLMAWWVGEQSLFMVQPQHELWGMLHPCWQENFHAGNNLIPRVIADTIYRLQPEAFYWINFEYYTTFPLSETWKKCSLANTERGAPLWTGSQMCEGLAANTEEAIRTGVRGFITGPLHPHCNPAIRAIQPWHMEAIKTSLTRWREARG